MNKEKLVVEVVGAHNLMPKDGEGTSSPFVEVEFENQRLKTEVKHKQLNPIWREKLVFRVSDVADLPYRTIEVNVFNEKKSSNSRNFLGRVSVSGTSIGKEGEELVSLYTLDKRSLFSHIRGEISLKIYLSSKEQVKDQPVVVEANVDVNANAKLPVSNVSKKGKKSTQEKKQSQETQHNSTSLVVKSGSSIPAKSGARNGGSGAAGSNGLTDFFLKGRNPYFSGGGFFNRGNSNSTYDLVEQMQYLYVRVEKAKTTTDFSKSQLIAEVKLGNYRGVTKVGSNNMEWGQVFAFSKDCIQASVTEVFVKENGKDDYIGRVWFDLNEVPTRVPPDSQLALQWYRMEDKTGDRSKTVEVMVSIWFGTQADEAFGEAWHSKAANVHFDGLSSIKSKVYLSPKLWYLRISIIEAQDIVPGEKGSSLIKYPELSAKIQVGNQVLRTRISQPLPNRAVSSPYWNEDLMFVVAEPFEEYLLITVEDRIAPGKDKVVGKVMIPLTAIERRTDDKNVTSRWCTLDSNNNAACSRIHLRASLDGGYHVLDEALVNSSDGKPTVKQLWKPHIGVLEMGILGATGLMPVKIKEGKGGCTDAYCVIKYGQKWVRTRTVVDNLSPKWNEQYTWEVYDPCTVITIGVFDNGHIDKSTTKNNGNSIQSQDSRIGKIRIRLSTLESNRVYTHSYPLLILHPSGMKKIGELHLAIRFLCANMGNMLQMYSMPLLPKMHYVKPLSVTQSEGLRYQAMNVVAGRLSRAEPPLGREVVEYMLDHDSNMWSMRKSKVNFFRLMNTLSWLVEIIRWVESVRTWNKPFYSTMFLMLYLWFVACPELIIPTMFLYMSILGIWRYRFRPRTPPRMDTKLSHVEGVFLDELDEEFDTFPSTRNEDIVRIRYDRLRSVAGRIQTWVGDLASQGERCQALISWRDPRASFLFLVFCLFCAVGFYMVPLRVAVALLGLYVLRPPSFQSKLPSPVMCFFKRMPTRADSLL